MKDRYYRGYIGKTGEYMRALDEYMWKSNNDRQNRVTTQNRSMRMFFGSLMKMIDIDYARSMSRGLL